MTYGARWQLVVDRDVHKALQRIPQKDAGRIISAIAELELNPYSGDVSKMHGEKDAWRRRIGAYRLFYEVLPERRMIHVYSLQRRTSTTY
jgi:mRNA-degrading endonuclease RelE of RelBE toxin-antitoxin system